MSPEAEALLDFWFGAQSEGFAAAQHRERWFAGGSAFDTVCRERFASLSADAEAGGCQHWLATARGTLAYVLLNDQLPRNLHRGSARAFACDERALAAARGGVRARQDRDLSFDERAFFYLPFEHSEDLLDQHTSVGLFTELRDATPPGQRHLTGDYLRHAHQHRDTIRRFGRFPYRNDALGRVSTPEEEAYLESLRSQGTA